MRRRHRRRHGAAPVPHHMPASLRTIARVVGSLLWISGGIWLLLHFFYQRPGEFGVELNPWQPVMMRLHGLIAVIGVFLLGWLGATHVTEVWRGAARRLSGYLLLGGCALLMVSGFLLYYLSGDTSHQVVAAVHELIGVAILAQAVAHGV